MTASFELRDHRPGDDPALAALERASPEGGRLVVQLDLRVGYSALAARYPGVRGYVAQAGAPPRVVGMLFCSLASTQLGGAIVPGAYLFSLRVDPAVRRRGVATALIEHACERARAEAGIAVTWAAVVGGNEASRRAFARAGFVPAGELVGRLAPRLPLVGRPALGVEPAATANLPVLADLLNRTHAAHDLWRPLGPVDLGAALRAADHDLADALLGRRADGAPLAAAAPFDLDRVARLRFLGHRRLPEPVNRVLAALARPLRPRVAVLRFRALPRDRPDAGLAVLRAALRRLPWPGGVLAVPLDRRDPAWPTVARLPAMSTPITVVARSAHPVGATRPLYLG